MKNSLPIAVIATCVLSSAPVASAQDNSARSMRKPVTMNGVQGGGMATGDGKAAPDGTGMMDGDIMRHHQMMEERISMMEMMMEQMLNHQQMTESVPAR